ncbi:MAG: ATP-binding cassette domain-containing protein [Clostridia bacterium]
MIELTNISKSYKTQSVLDKISFFAKSNQFSSIMGMSGSGKTTLLRIIAGLIRPDEGQVKIDKIVVGSKNVYVEPYKRSLGYVFQEAALWPHMTVEKNISFGLANMNRKEILNRTNLIMKHTNTLEYRHKYPSQISGGQAKRVALARALAPNPKYILLDEPLTNLDFKARIELLDLLVSIKENSDAGFVYVSHQKDEIDYLKGNLWILKSGKLVKDE